jgi:hypothetical protein
VADTSLKSEVQLFAAVGDYPATTAEYVRTSFEDLTYGGTVWPNKAASLTAQTAMFFRVTTAIGVVPDPRLRYVFDGIASLGQALDGAALLRTDSNLLRLSGTTTVDLAINDVSRVTLTDTQLDVKVPTTFGANLVSADTVDVGEVQTEVLTYHLPVGIDLFPTIPGWTPTVGTVTYGGIVSDVSIAQAADLWSYHVKINYTLAAPVEELATLLVPIYLSGGQANLRGIIGVHRKMSGVPPGGVPTVTYGLPGDALWVQEPFDVDANLTAIRCVGYQFLMVRIRKQVGSWEVEATLTIASP